MNETSMRLEADIMLVGIEEMHDNQLLDKMRSVVKDYVGLSLQNKATEQVKKSYKESFDALHGKLKDSILKEYSSFDFMEKLCMQEHLVD